ncbi:hypothetical protein AAE478_005433 [Parahypoxylon ruwenzoriense]
MSSRQLQLRPNGGLQPLRRGTALPTRFKCIVGGEWADVRKFSQNQLAKWRKMKRGDGHDDITPENVGLICKTHSQRPTEREAECHGPCGAWKRLEHFSKSQRNSPDAWCSACTAWRTQFNGDEAPIPAPNTQMGPGEVIGQTSAVQGQGPSAAPGGLLSGPGEGASTHARTQIQGPSIRDDDLDSIGGSVLGGIAGLVINKERFNMNGRDTGIDNGGILDDSSVATFTGHGRLKEEVALLRNSAAYEDTVCSSGYYPYNSGDCDETATLKSGSRAANNTPSLLSNPDLYSYNAFYPSELRGSRGDTGDEKTIKTADKTSAMDSPGGTGAVANSAANVTRKAEMKVCRKGGFVRGDNRRVFYAPHQPATRPADHLKTREEDESTDEY